MAVFISSVYLSCNPFIRLHHGSQCSTASRAVYVFCRCTVVYQCPPYPAAHCVGPGNAEKTSRARPFPHAESATLKHPVSPPMQQPPPLSLQSHLSEVVDHHMNGVHAVNALNCPFPKMSRRRCAVCSGIATEMQTGSNILDAL